MLRFKKNTLLLLGMILVNVALTAQSGSTNQFSNLKLPNVLPPSPDVTAIEKFGNIPVSYATGVPNISIPLYSISCGDIKWPLEISYNASGIKVDEYASRVGLGWALTGPGMISRSVAGLPDESESGEPQYNSVSYSNWQFLYDVLDGHDDSEFDIFNYSFNGRSGKFIIKQDGTVMQIPLTDLKISYTVSLGSFTIIDENGVNYLFDKKETAFPEIRSGGATQLLPSYTSTWFLSKVELPNQKQKIEFNYVSAGNSSQYFKNFTHILGNKYLSLFSPTFINQESYSTTFTSINTLRLTGISFPNGNININYINDRQDIGSSDRNRISEIIVNTINGNNTNRLKRIVFNQNYFFYKPANIPSVDYRQYRLKLDSISEYGDENSTSPKTYGFQYNSTPLLPIESFGQDKWGYNNGKNFNSSLIESKSVFWFGMGPFNIGNADRSTNSTEMQGWMLTSINYPTGGTTEFQYEPNQYYYGQVINKTTHLVEVQSDIQQSALKTFTFPTNGLVASPRMKAFISKYNFPGVTAPPRVVLKDLTTNTQTNFITSTTPDVDINTETQIYLTPGHSYELKADVFTSIAYPNLKITTSVEWQNFSAQPLVESGAGLRVKEIRNLTDLASIASIETFEYEPAVTLIPVDFLARSLQETIQKFCQPDLTPYPSPPIGCQCVSPTNPFHVYFAASVFPLATALGSPILYTKVVRKSTNSLNTLMNGKTEYEYHVFPNAEIATSNQYFYTQLVDESWKNGFLSKETIFKFENGSYIPVHKKEYIYSTTKESYTTGLRVFPKFSIEGNCSLKNQQTAFDEITLLTYPINTGSKQVIRVEETLYDPNGQIVTVTDNEFGSSLHYFVTKRKITDSKGTQQSETYKYPQDLSSPGNISEKMVTINMVAPVIEQKSFSGTSLLATTYSTYKDWFNDNKVIKPEIIQGSLYNNSLENRIRFYAYDSYGNLLEASKENDAKEVYFWGYNSQYPVAKIIGKSYSEALTESGINLTVINNPSSDLAMRTELNKLRQLTGCFVNTYTYNPLVGITSQTDPNGRSTYYDYDEFGRLIIIRDQDKNIIKKYCYTYKGQTENCSIFYNDQRSQAFTKACTAGTVGSSVTYTVPAGTYAASTLALANQKADKEILANGQAFANANGTCAAPPCSFTSSPGFVILTSGISNSGGTVSFYIVFNSTSGSTNWYSQNQVATISTGCRPFSNKTFNRSESGRVWEITVTTSGAFYIRLVSGTPPSGSTAVGITGGSYNQ